MGEEAPLGSLVGKPEGTCIGFLASPLGNVACGHQEASSLGLRGNIFCLSPHFLPCSIPTFRLLRLSPGDLYGNRTPGSWKCDPLSSALLVNMRDKGWVLDKTKVKCPADMLISVRGDWNQQGLAPFGEDKGSLREAQGDGCWGQTQPDEMLPDEN